MRSVCAQAWPTSAVTCLTPVSHLSHTCISLSDEERLCSGLAHLCCHLYVAETLLSFQKKLVLRAVEEDQAGQWSAALSHYCSALEHFVPAIHYETEAQRKDALRQKVSQYVSRAEELKALLASHHRLSFEEARTSTGVLREMSRDQPRLLAALNMASAAIANEENGLIHEALDLYQQCLGELLLVLAAETQGRRRELLHREIKSLMNRAEYTKEQIKMQETQRDASLEPEPLADSVRSCEFLLLILEPGQHM
ncbi:Serine/threonine-protein kinase ULK3 [Takifugu flavidus]|uniref:Serine/threonine-protein kinase ULK3 n=1 Tax=Takifugu flavidus TaxID=433684 RepID=A0A5C6NMU5_9TELE|nr:Serine/threonine-protein kinase ULK3 [Takifugu flavidus]